jgi:hypothetical protein
MNQIADSFYRIPNGEKRRTRNSQIFSQMNQIGNYPISEELELGFD